jgi:hypothetical protein
MVLSAALCQSLLACYSGELYLPLNMEQPLPYNLLETEMLANFRYLSSTLASKSSHSVIYTIGEAGCYLGTDRQKYPFCFNKPNYLSITQ